jgi:hypothetical protein
VFPATTKNHEFTLGTDDFLCRPPYLATRLEQEPRKAEEGVVRAHHLRSKIIIIIIFLHSLGRLICYGIVALPSFPGASAIPFSPGFVCEGVFRESGVVHSFEVVDPV